MIKIEFGKITNKIYMNGFIEAEFPAKEPKEKSTEEMKNYYFELINDYEKQIRYSKDILKALSEV